MGPGTDVRTPRGTALLTPLAVGVAGAAAVALLHVRDPHSGGSYGTCPFLALTGLPCPGCGSLRAVNDLSRGDVVGAVSSNALAVVLVGTLVVAWALWLVRRARGRVEPTAVPSLQTGLVVLAVVVVFGVFRLTPWGSWLAP